MQRTAALVLFGLGLATASAPPAAAQSAANGGRRGEIVVEVAGLSPGGTLLVALFDKPDRFPSFKGQVAAKRVGVAGSTATAVFERVPFGRYAVAVVHDRNNNGRLDTKFGVIPAEPIGFSNRAKIGRFGPPSFDAAAFRLDTSRRAVPIAVE